jgi:mannitol-1-phosphate/altronate dehydrogenase
VGVQFSDEVKMWEQVKVRVLNAGHLTLAYPALLLGYREVAEATRDPQIPVLLERFLDKTVLPLLEAPRDLTLVDYKNTVLERFSNEAMHDQLTRIASDSASKVTVFLTTTLREVLARGANHHIPAFILAAWSRVLQGEDDDGKSFDVTESRLDENARRLLVSGDPREAMRIEALVASGAAEHTDFVATFAHYRNALADSWLTHHEKALCIRSIRPNLLSRKGSPTFPLVVSQVAGRVRDQTLIAPE